MSIQDFNRPFLCIDKQIDLLKTRGLSITDINKTRDFLTIKNYYNIVNRYGQYYFDPSSQKFNEGTHFDDIVNLYFFDNELKHTFYRKLMKVESHFKSVLAHVFAEFHNEEYSYLNPNNFDSNKHTEILQLIPKLSNQINYNNKKNSPNNPIKHHMTKYGHVPIWVLVNYMYMTDAVKFYSVMNKSEQNQIARVFSEKFGQQYKIDNVMITPEQLKSFLSFLNDLRNLLAHDNFFFGSKIKRSPKHCYYVHSSFYTDSNEIEKSIYDALIVIRVFLEYDSYRNIHNKVRKLMNTLKNESNQEETNKILSVMGFPADWNLGPILKKR